ncbi:MAG: TetR family transcriptional regulator C-terminal domain-containing protein [Caulobacteraceae bacterium]|nr:TetR family transcriptional regulator C-terminal domain-containing protein [Caulobacteraceae bacterium]
MSAAEATAGRRKRLKPEERRLQIIETTLTCLARDGAEGASLRSVCREIGVAPSLIGHFYVNWHDLLVAAYDLLVERFMAKLAPVVDAPYPSARGRMEAVIDAYLSTDWAGDSSIGASIAFWQLSRGMPELKAAFGRYLAGRRQLLSQALAALVAEAGAKVDVAQLTDGLMLMLDGVWLEISLNPGSIAEARTHQMCWFWLDAALGRPPAAQT